MRKIVLGALLAAPFLLLAPPSSQAAGRGGFEGHGSFASHHAYGGYHPPGHFHSRVFVGVSPFWWPDPWWWWGPPPFGYAYGWGYGYWGPPAVVIQEPPVYIERDETAPDAYWYYCPSAREYYPRVGTCPEPWVKVPPAPR